jgi:transposase
LTMDDDGVQQLARRLVACEGCGLIVLEATGGLQERAAAVLAAAGLAVAGGQPAPSARLRPRHRLVSKTDRLDAAASLGSRPLSGRPRAHCPMRHAGN